MGKFFDAIAKSEYEAKNKSEPDSEEKAEISLAVENKEGISFAIDEKVIAYHSSQTFEAEQFRLLKASLAFPKTGNAARTIMVTSAEPNDGKSLVSANLAVTFARTLDAHVVLVDCDLRNSTIHRLFGIDENRMGLSNWLRGKAELGDILCKNQIEKFRVIPGGTLCENTSELVSSSRMIELISELKDRYTDRYIILDSPPPLLASETLALSTLVDGVLVVVRHEKTKRGAVRKMIDAIGEDKIIGVILNSYESRTERYYGYDYGYGTYNKR